MKTMTNMPTCLLVLGLRQLYPSFVECDPKVLLKDLPVYDVLHYVIERQARVEYTYSDINAQMELASEMYKYLSLYAKQNLYTVIANNPHQVLFSNMATFPFIMLALESCDYSFSRSLNDEEIEKVYQAYLYCNDYWSDKQSLGIRPLITTKNLVGMYLMADVPIVEFKSFKDFRPQLYKAYRLFEFMEKDSMYSAYLKVFLSKSNVKDWQEYLSCLFSFYQSAISKPIINVERQDNRFYPFFDSLCIECDQCNALWDNHDMNYLRNHPLFRMKEGFYMVLNANLLVDRLYQCLKFNIYDAIKGTGVDVNRKGKTIRDCCSFLGMLGEDFSESQVFYSIMHKTFDGIADAVLDGMTMKNANVHAEPDFYVRIGRKVFLFEYKDNSISDDVKYSGDYQIIRAVILSRICFDDGNTRKGVGQLLNSINEIVNSSSLNALDSEAKSADCYYPIVVTTDRVFSSLGVQNILVEQFNTIVKNWTIPAFVRIPMVLDLDTLIVMSKRVHDKTISFLDLIEEYLNVNELKLSSFETFYTDKYRDLKQMNVEDVKFLYGEMFAAM